MDFAARILAIRKSLHMSQERFGELVSMSQRTVAAWESGERLPSLQVLQDLAAALGVSVDHLLGNEKQPADDIDGLRADALRRVQALPDPALRRLLDFLDGLQAGQDIAAAQPGAQDPGQGSSPPPSPASPALS